MPHPTLYEEMKKSQYVHRPLLLLHPAIFEERFTAQHQDIQAFLVDNKRLVATHVTPKANKDGQMGALYEKSVSLELDLHGELTSKAHDLTRITTDLQQILALRAEIEAMKQELQRYAENYEHGQMMEKKLISMARELEKLRAEMANTENRTCVFALKHFPPFAAFFSFLLSFF
ncbi:hypothetical protein UlMin_012358 [Ulmus minor]